MKNVEIEVSEPQRVILESTKDLNLFLAAVGSGKTTSLSFIAADFVINHPHALGFIGANTYQQLTKSTLKNTFETWRNIFGWINGVHYVVDHIPPKTYKSFNPPLKSYENTICFNNGALIFTGSLDNYKAFDGTEIAWALLDETKDTKEEAIKDVIIWRLRQKAMYIKDGIIYHQPIEGSLGYCPLYIFTSPAKVDWINEWFGLTDKYEEISRHIFSKTDFFQYEDDRVCVTISSAYHNEKNLPAGYIEKRIKDFAGNENKINMMIYGSPIAKTGGEFYHQFSVIKHVNDVPMLDDVNVHISLDFNVAPYITMTCSQIVLKDGIYWDRQFRELCLPAPKNSTEELCKEFLAQVVYPYENRTGKKFPALYYYGDASGKNRSTLDKEHNFDKLIRVLRKYLNSSSDRVVKRNPSIVAARDFTNKILAEGLPIRILIDRSCKNTIADMEFMKEAPDGGILIVRMKDPMTGSMVEKYGHCGASQRYKLVAAYDTMFDKE